MKDRRRRIGAELSERGVSFRVYAPGRSQVEVVVDAGARGDGGQKGDRVARRLAPEEQTGYFSGTVPELGAGARYWYRLAGDDALYPDPASRSQPDGPFGPSEVVDPGAYRWSDDDFPGLSADGQVIYELHIGTFTREGTWRAAAQRLPHLARLGITAIEMLPVAEFAGARGWGYDGVNLFAPYHHYGRPDDLRDFVAEAHRLGLGVILDVVYNHFGPAGNFISKFAPTYLTKELTEWGEGLNFDSEGAAATRELVTENATYWIDEFHMDGLRIDATQAVLDRSQPHILQEIAASARRAGGKRSIFVVGENEPQDANLARPVESGGLGLDALWNDDFHHSAVVALTGHREAYYSDYDGSARELLAAVKHGFLFQGQRYDWQRKPRGRSTRGLPPRAFVAFLENHDQTANYGVGRRLWCRCDPGNYRALTALLLLGPWTPMLFQGQEWYSDSLFTYFADHEGELAGQIESGRATFLAQFPRYASEAARGRFLSPGRPETFAACQLDWERLDDQEHARALRLHRDLLRLRRQDKTLGRPGTTIDGAGIDRDRLLVRFYGADPSGSGDRLLLVNLGIDYEPRSLSEPLSAPPPGYHWGLRWSSSHPRYGGEGVRPTAAARGLLFAGHAAELLIPRTGAVPPDEAPQPKPATGAPALKSDG
ncbi:MAG TPA: malto-oligosyltrehalose trehalohydrolase [Polyangia bacterium]